MPIELNFEINFVELALKNGFDLYQQDIKSFRPNDNWYGISLYHPDAILIKNKKEIIISLQGLSMRYPYEKIEGFNEIAKQRGLKYISFNIDKQVEYETFFGVLPASEFIKSFITK